MKVNVTGAGSGRPILLLHGGGVAGWMWQPLIEHMRAEHRFIVPDLPGHDESADEPYRSHARTIHALATMLERRAESPAVVVGFSLGAQLAVLLASHRPDLVERTVAISAQAVPSRWPAATLAALRAAAPLAKNERFARLQAKALFVPQPLIPDYLRTSRLLATQTLLASVGENIRFTVASGWRAHPGPSLVLVGASEQPMMRTSASILANARGGEAEVVPGSGHGIPLQRPEWLARRLTEWCETPVSRPGAPDAPPQ